MTDNVTLVSPVNGKLKEDVDEKLRTYNEFSKPKLNSMSHIFI